MCTSAANVAAVSMQAYEKMITVDTNNLANSLAKLIVSQYKRLSSVLKIHETQNEQGKDKYIKVWS